LVPSPWLACLGKSALKRGIGFAATKIFAQNFHLIFNCNPFRTICPSSPGSFLPLPDPFLHLHALGLLSIHPFPSGTYRTCSTSSGSFQTFCPFSPLSVPVGSFQFPVSLNTSFFIVLVSGVSGFPTVPVFPQFPGFPPFPVSQSTSLDVFLFRSFFCFRFPVFPTISGFSRGFRFFPRLRSSHSFRFLHFPDLTWPLCLVSTHFRPSIPSIPRKPSILLQVFDSWRIFAPLYSLEILQDLVFLHVVSSLDLRTTDTPS